MKRVALILATVAILCVAAAGQAQAHPYHHGHGGYHGAYYGGYYRPVVVRPTVVYSPAVVPAPIYPPYYGNRCDYPAPYYSNFYYQGRGLSIGIGF